MVPIILGIPQVETPALAIVMPLIVRGLKDRDERQEAFHLGRGFRT